MEDLILSDYQRYGRQMILDGIGLDGQIKLQNAAVVVVGAGGLGCPSLQYLAAAGIGKIAIIDHDIVETSNLQRQILHNESTAGMFKAESAARAISNLNSRVKVEAISQPLNPTNAVQLLAPYDVILDCTDNTPTRYLLNDTAVRLGKPLVSGAAQKFYGQLCTYNLGENGVCYRCLLPKPPLIPQTCEETGILGAVTGVIGTLQALEAIKIIVGLHDMKSSLLTFSALHSPPFHSVPLSKRPSCPACGKDGQRIGEIQDIDYVQFCGGPTRDWEREGMINTGPDYRITVKDLQSIITNSEQKPDIVDVRTKTEFGICHLPDSKNIPLDKFTSSFDLSDFTADHDENTEVYFICRLGNDSQVAADHLREYVKKNTETRKFVIKDVIGGLKAWSRDVDPLFPVY